MTQAMRLDLLGRRAVSMGLLTLATSSLLPTRRARAQGLLHVKMAIGGVSWLPYAPVVLAQKLGLYEKYGIDLEFFTIADGAATAQAIASASADVGSGFFDHCTQITSRGRNVVGIVLVTRLPGLAMFVTPKHESEINSAADLVGKPVGSSALAGSTSMFMLRHYLDKNHIDLEQVPITLVGGPSTTLVAVEHGNTVAIVTGEPSITLVEERAGRPLKKLWDTRTVAGTVDFYGGEYPSATIYALRGWIDSHPHEAQGVVSAIVESLGTFASHTPEQIVAMMPDEAKGSDKDLYLAVFKNMVQIFSPDGRFTDDGTRLAVRILSAAIPEVGHANVDVHQLYTNQFIDAVHGTRL